MNRNFKRRRTVTKAVTLLCIFAFALVLLLFKSIYNPLPSIDSDSDFVEFIDVGQGDSALIYSNGYCAVIDVGERNSMPAVREKLDSYGIKHIDALIISHLHSDHVGALPDIEKLYKIDNLFMPTIPKNAIATAKAGKEKAVKNGSAFYNAKPGMNFDLGDFEITFLSDFEDRDEENNRSLFVMAKIGSKKILFTGDAETEEENKLLAENINVDCDILKVGHHGSSSSTGNKFIKRTTPQYSVISVGKNNSYGHPSTFVLNSLKYNKAKIYRTDINGDIMFTFKDNEISVRTDK